MKTLDRLKSKLVDDAAVADTSKRRPGSASRRKNLIPLKPRAYGDGTEFMGAMPMKPPKGRKVPVSPEENGWSPASPKPLPGNQHYTWGIPTGLN